MSSWWVRFVIIFKLAQDKQLTAVAWYIAKQHWRFYRFGHGSRRVVSGHEGLLLWLRPFVIQYDSILFGTQQARNWCNYEAWITKLQDSPADSWTYKSVFKYCSAFLLQMTQTTCTAEILNTYLRINFCERMTGSVQK